MLHKRNGKPNLILDIGSGDGRIVIAGAQSGFKSHGVELNPWLVYYSRLSAFKNGVFKQTKFFRKDLWKFDTSLYDNIIIFGVEEMVCYFSMLPLNKLKNYIFLDERC